MHGPHVDSSKKPETAAVTMDVIIPSLGGKKATIHRTVKNSGKPTITPGDDDVLAAFDHVQRHPEFVLSRRELMRYVLSEAGQRSKEVQSLLRLDDIEKLRRFFRKFPTPAPKSFRCCAALNRLPKPRFWPCWH